MTLDLETVTNDSDELVAELPEGMTLHRVRVGIHEAGHSLAADALGGTVRFARLEMSWLGLGDSVSGGLAQWRLPAMPEDDGEDRPDNQADAAIKVMLAGNEAGSWAWHHYLGYDLSQARKCELPGSGYDMSEARALRKHATKPIKRLQREVEQLMKVNRRTLFSLGLQVAQKKQVDGRNLADQAKAAA